MSLLINVLLVVTSFPVMPRPARAQNRGASEDVEAKSRTRDTFKRADWRSLPPSQLKQLVSTSALTYGLEPRADRLRALEDLYVEFVKRVSLEERVDVSVSVALKVEKGLSGADAMMPFLSYDPALAVVSSSALDMAVLVRTSDRDDLLAGPKQVCAVAKTLPSDQRRGQIVAGVFLLGDRRLMPVVRDCFQALGTAGRKELSIAWSGFAYRAVIEFFLDWLEAARVREDEFGSVAGTLARLAIQARPREVLDIERQLPVSGKRDAGDVRIVQRWTIDEYGQIIAPRLRALAQREREPKIMPLVMDAWGVKE
jgi:hypothetical protein